MFDELVADEKEVGAFKAKAIYAQYIDENDDPRKWGDELGTMVCGHRDYILGDEQIDGSHEWTAECERCEGYGHDPERYELLRGTGGYGFIKSAAGTEEAMSALMHTEEQLRPETNWYVDPAACLSCKGDGQHELTPTEWAKRERGARVVLPLILYDHSGISMSVSRGYPYNCPWDAGQVGIIFDTPEAHEILGTGDFSNEKIAEALEAEVETYDAFLRGEVYVAVVEDENGDTVEAVHGFLGDDKYAMEEAVSMAECCEEDRLKEIKEREYWESRDVVTA